MPTAAPAFSAVPVSGVALVAAVTSSAPAVVPVRSPHRGCRLAGVVAHPCSTPHRCPPPHFPLAPAPRGPHQAAPHLIPLTSAPLTSAPLTSAPLTSTPLERDPHEQM
ncbi:hypothetical protein ABZ345_33970 [Lentzea sp. NPDC005914]|uniref:hypothetical protein n=1 Tax=Lentzea sp. NPDC005914 TaxID=3154572 RepID=UPI0034043152